MAKTEFLTAEVYHKELIFSCLKLWNSYSELFSSNFKKIDEPFWIRKYGESGRLQDLSLLLRRHSGVIHCEEPFEMFCRFFFVLVQYKNSLASHTRYIIFYFFSKMDDLWAVSRALARIFIQFAWPKYYKNYWYEIKTMNSRNFACKTLRVILYKLYYIEFLRKYCRI